jgi:uncharacterized protein (TIGR02145 family)
MVKLIIFISLFFLFSCITPIEKPIEHVVIKDTMPIIPSPNEKEVLIVDSVLTDKRDQQQYKIKRFKNLWWMIENLNYDIGDSLLYKDTYIGMAGYCLDNNPENCAQYGRLYDLPAAIKACPKGWRIPNRYEWIELNKKYANCIWNKASTTGNYRDSLPDYNPISSANAKWNREEKKVYFYTIDNLARYWAINNTSSSALIYSIDIEKCHATLVDVGSTSRLLAQRKFYSCRCVQEAN